MTTIADHLVAALENAGLVQPEENEVNEEILLDDSPSAGEVLELQRLTDGALATLEAIAPLLDNPAVSQHAKDAMQGVYQTMRLTGLGLESADTSEGLIDTIATLESHLVASMEDFSLAKFFDGMKKLREATKELESDLGSVPKVPDKDYTESFSNIKVALLFAVSRKQLDGKEWVVEANKTIDTMRKLIKIESDSIAAAEQVNQLIISSKVTTEQELDALHSKLKAVTNPGVQLKQFHNFDMIRTSRIDVQENPVRGDLGNWRTEYRPTINTKLRPKDIAAVVMITATLVPAAAFIAAHVVSDAVNRTHVVYDDLIKVAHTFVKLSKEMEPLYKQAVSLDSDQQTTVRKAIDRWSGNLVQSKVSDIRKIAVNANAQPWNGISEILWYLTGVVGDLQRLIDRLVD